MSIAEKSGASLSKHLQLLLGIVVSGACLVLLSWNVQWDRFVAALEGAQYWWLLPSLATIAVAVGLKVVKWRLLLLPVGKTSRVNLLYSLSTGYLVSMVLPGRVGEVARAYLLARLERLSPVAVLSSVVVDRILDVVAVALVVAVVLPTVNLPWWVTQSGLVIGAGGIGLLVSCVVLAYPPGERLLLRLLSASPRFPGKSRIEQWAEELCLGLSGLRGMDAQIRVYSATLGIWLVTILTYFFGLLAFHIEVSPWAAVVVMAVTNLGAAVPSSPGYIGVYHYLVVLALGAFGVEKEVALGFAVVLHLVGLMPVVLLGAFSLWRCGLTLMGWRDNESM